MYTQHLGPKNYKHVSKALFSENDVRGRLFIF